MKGLALLLSLFAGLAGWNYAAAEVEWRRLSEENVFVKVRDDSWQPEGFESGIVIPAAYVVEPAIGLDGRDNEAAWDQAEEVPLSLMHGSVKEASVKAVYTDSEVFIRVRWPDPSENREHHPWTWDVGEQRYVSGTQSEDAVLLSFEAGCEWGPSLLQGYVFDFDGWHWLAARSDPVGQAWDLSGNVQDHPSSGQGFEEYPARKSGMDWNVKFVDRAAPDILHDDWSRLKRMYLYRRAGETVYFRTTPDLISATDAVVELAPPVGPPNDPAERFPQFEAIRLMGDAGEVSAKGNWEAGYWTVEFRRDLVTPSNTLTDWVFTRLSQFSIHVFDGVERIDQSSESGRLYLRFTAPESLATSE